MQPLVPLNSEVAAVTGFSYEKMYDPFVGQKKNWPK